MVWRIRFNNMLIDTLYGIDPELKQRIDAFLSERRNKNTALDKPPEEIVKMDESA